jgi:iron complex outermembrane receptor protein
MKSILSAVIGATLALSAIEVGADGTPGARQVSLTIETDTLAAALDKWAQQTGFQIFVQDWEATQNLPAKTLKGTFTAQDALEHLLSGTSLTYIWISDKAVSIRKNTVKTVPTALQRTSLDGQPGIPVAKFSGDDVGGVSAVAAPKADVGNRNPAPREEVEEVIVTGTHITGARPTAAPVRVYSREMIERSGSATLGQFARQIPQNFSNADTVANERSSAQFSQTGASGNSFQGSAFNLHGLGTSATLTLLNGHRLASGGPEGSLTDISLIPLAAIDHVEVVSGGASAIYGSDAIAGVVNIITREELSGAETSVRYGVPTEGGGTELVASQMLAGSWGGGGAFLNYEYYDQDNLNLSDRDFLPQHGGTYALVPGNRRNSAFASVRHDVGDSTTLSLDALYSERKYQYQTDFRSAAANTETLNDGKVKQSGATLALGQALRSDWRLNAAASFSRMDQTDFTHTTFLSPLDFTQFTETAALADLREIDVRASGSLFELAGGSVKTAVGVAYREEDFETDSVVQTVFAGGEISVPTLLPELNRNVKSAYAEIRAPLIGPGNASSWTHRLELSVAARHDDYSDFGSSDDPKAELLWEPVAGLAFKGTYGTSFKAPALRQIGAPPIFSASYFLDAQSPFGLTPALSLQGSNPDLSPEKSESFTVGFDWTPSSIAGLTVAMNYFETNFRDRITFPPSTTFNDLTDPLLQRFVVRNPPLELVEAYFADPNFREDSTLLGPGGIEALIDLRYTNIARTEQSGVDLFVDFARPVGSSYLDISLGATRLLKNDYQVSDLVAGVELLDKFAQPTKWKGRTSVAWMRGGFTANATINYVNSYSNSLFTPEEPIDSWTTGDLYFSYRTPKESAPSGLRDLTIALSITNVSNEEPPFVQTPGLAFGEDPLPFDPVNSSPVGRVVSLGVTKKW